MGLGAGFKLKESKDKEKDKENIKKEEKIERHKSKKEKGHADEDLSSHDVYAPSGWTSILEDWLCNGSGCKTKATESGMSNSPPSPGLPPPKHMSTGNLPDHTSNKEQWKGPYVPLIKERMMGLYLTVFIHRDIRSLVRGQ